MKNNLVADNDIFKATLNHRVAVLTLKSNPLFRLTDLDAKKTLLDYLDAIDQCSDIRVLLIVEVPQKPEYDGYMDLFYSIMIAGRGGRKIQIHDSAIRPFINQSALARYCNAVNQLVLKIVQACQFIIHVDQGIIISPFMNISLACDYRIVSNNSIFKNPYLTAS